MNHKVNKYTNRWQSCTSLCKSAFVCQERSNTKYSVSVQESPKPSHFSAFGIAEKTNM